MELRKALDFVDTLEVRERKRSLVLKEWCLLPALLSCVIFGDAGIRSQKVTTKVKVYNDIFLTDSGLIPLPENAVEMEREFTIGSAIFQSPLKLAGDPKGNIYASSSRNGAVGKFNAAGEFLLQLGTRGEGKSSFQDPCDIVAIRDYLIVHDRGRKRLEFIDNQGTRLKSRRIPELHDMDADANGHVYIAPYVETGDSPLVVAYSPEGKETVFGKPLVFSHSMTTLNSRSLVLNERGEIFIAFTYFPIIRRYSLKGMLLDEFRIESPTMDAKAAYNLKAVGEGIVDPLQRANLKALIVDIQVSDDRIYVLSHVPRLEITEMDFEGKPRATFWMDFQEVYIANGFRVLDAAGDKRFYVAHSSPPRYDIDVFRKRQKTRSDPTAEIDELNREIAAYPDHYLAYNNRGVEKHRLGDYRGALEDFTKAIEFAPNSAIAYNNRGLSRVKTADFEGAIRDFTLAIELDPNVAAVFFNRGIARAHKSDFDNAIRDFEKAATLDPAFGPKVREQIDYCNVRRKK